MGCVGYLRPLVNEELPALSASKALPAIRETLYLCPTGDFEWGLVCRGGGGGADWNGAEADGSRFIRFSRFFDDSNTT